MAGEEWQYCTVGGGGGAAAAFQIVEGFLRILQDFQYILVFTNDHS